MPAECNMNEMEFEALKMDQIPWRKDIVQDRHGGITTSSIEMKELASPRDRTIKQFVFDYRREAKMVLSKTYVQSQRKQMRSSTTPISQNVQRVSNRNSILLLRTIESQMAIFLT